MTTAEWTTGSAPALVLRGTGARPERVELVGARARVAATLTGRGKTWTATLMLSASRWGGPLLPLPSGRYRLHVESAGSTETPEAPDPLALSQLGSLRAALTGWELEIGPPVDPAYDAGEAQGALERRYATGREPLEEAVFFESFYGRNASCNPLAIDRVLRERIPGLVRYWSVVDLSVDVPEGAIPVVEGSPDWWRARAVSRLLVVNDWMRRRYVRRPGQHVVQTWHGTPLKRLALHRPGFDPRRAVAVVRESRRWNVLLAQNQYAASILRRAYAFGRRPIWVEGYPRNDVLRTGDAAGVRARLGIGEDERVILYAPTWRDDREQIVDFLDAERLAADTGAVVLVRGHSRTLLPGRDAEGARVVDVTGFPDTAQLLLAADALVTDYSSVMFDFTVTGKPVYFFVPDLEDYRGRLRGFYFDLAQRAPGPLVRTQEELTRAVAQDTAAYADRYAAWQRAFNAREDGHAAERVVARILDQGLIGG
ncbi:CDP-glycerol glycerophosphotransferase family protein [Microbacterium sp. BG28]|uniref:CDP-glycerol glycerophosphotransferase family protein n=1 Tax=Microbacterium sp. BG28 TaxID=3097356 RepID=UPI002A5A2214|nr:CDP-glycerol glycerophosphotransferase family protein [Microbacterium sp. BG28]MDY0828869.1 CDP-glycerol glycerophosphotransferase family protein [Microbacterium sp. BG28]